MDQEQIAEEEAPSPNSGHSQPVEEEAPASSVAVQASQETAEEGTAGESPPLTTNTVATGSGTNLLASIRHKLSSAGLTDEAPGLTTAALLANNKSPASHKSNQHRRSRSLGEVTFQKEFLQPISSTIAAAVATDHPPPKSLKLSSRNVTEHMPMLSLEQVKRNLLQEIKVKLKKQIELKTSECQNNSELKDQVHIADKDEEVEEPKSRETGTINDQEQPETVQHDEIRGDDNIKDIAPAKSGEEGGENKRYSICSLSGVELRKRYSPVYERTRKIVRQSSTSINRWSNSQPQVQQQQPPGSSPEPTEATAAASVNGRRPAVLSRVTSKGDLEQLGDEGVDVDTAECSLNVSQVGNGDSVSPQQMKGSVNRGGGPAAATTTTTTTTDHPSSIVSSLQSMNSNRTAQPENGRPNVPHTPNNTTEGEFFAASNHHMNSSYPRIGGQYSAHPSVYVIERDQRVGASSGIESSLGSRSEKMDRSTSTLKRGASFKGLRKNLKKTFSTTMPAMTLEKAEKALHSNIPMIVVCCIETLQSKGFLKTEGLYRSSPSQVEVRKVIKYAQKGQYDYVKSVDDPVVLAGTLKSFFFTLKHHIISAEVMEKNFPKKCLIENTSEQECIERLKGVISDLETIHYDTLEYLIKHLQEVASHSKHNLMTPSNLGVVWAPCLFTNCDKSMDGADLLSFMGQQTRLMELLITHVDLLFDRYTIDEIMIAIEYSSESLLDGEPALNLRPGYDLTNGGHELERRKLMRNLSLTFDNVFEGSNGGGGVAIEGNAPRRNYDLQNSYTAPVMGAQSDSTIARRKNLKQNAAIKRDRRCVIS